MYFNREILKHRVHRKLYHVTKFSIYLSFLVLYNHTKIVQGRLCRRLIPVEILVDSKRPNVPLNLNVKYSNYKFMCETKIII